MNPFDQFDEDKQERARNPFDQFDQPKTAQQTRGRRDTSAAAALTAVGPDLLDPNPRPGMQLYRQEGTDNYVEAPHNLTPEQIAQLPRVRQTSPLSEAKDTATAMISGVNNLAYMGADDELADLFGMKGYRATQDRLREEKPAAFMGGQTIAGMVPVTQGAQVAKAAPGVLSTIAKGTGIAGLLGAGYGYGDTDEGSRAVGTLQGAGAGATAGGALGAVMAGLGRYGPMAKDASSKAVRMVKKRLERDGVSPEALRQAASDPVNRDAASMLFELGGANTRGLAQASGTVSGPGREIAEQALDARALASSDDILNQARRSMGARGANYFDDLDTLDATRKANSAPLYDEAFREPILFEEYTSRIEPLLKRPSGQQALRNAQRLAQDEGASGNVMGLVMENGQARFRSNPNLRTLDYVKRGFDDILEGYRDTTTGKLVLDDRGRTVAKLRDEFVQALDDVASPRYQEARAAYAGPSRQRDAMQFGRDTVLRRLQPEEIQRRTASMSADERQAYINGTLRGLDERLGDRVDTGDMAGQIARNRNMRERLRPAFDQPDKFEDFMRLLDTKRTQAQNRNAILGNSQTAMRQEAMRDATEDGVDQFIGEAASGGPRSAAVRWLVNKGREARAWGLRDEKVNREVAEMLFAEVNPQTRQIIEERIAAGDPAVLALLRRIENDMLAAGQLGSAIENKSSPTQPALLPAPR